VVTIQRGLVVQPARLGMIVGRQVGPAVTRNRIRRVIRSTVREEASNLTGASIVVRALPSASAVSHGELRRVLRAALGPASTDRHASDSNSASALVDSLDEVDAWS
jgi:RNase P protein component